MQEAGGFVAPDERSVVAPDAHGVHLTTDEPRRIVEAGLAPLRIEGRTHTLDHVAMVVGSGAAVERKVAALVGCGADLVEAPYLFPDDVCDTPVPVDQKKFMGTVALATGLLIVSAPASRGDQLDRHLARWGTMVPHHIAVRVPSVAAAVPRWAAVGNRVGRITDDGDLAQVFMGSPTGQVVELISRRNPSHDTWSCANVAALSADEDAVRGPGSVR